jgi:hypothetical protein
MWGRADIAELMASLRHFPLKKPIHVCQKYEIEEFAQSFNPYL